LLRRKVDSDVFLRRAVRFRKELPSAETRQRDASKTLRVYQLKWCEKRLFGSRQSQLRKATKRTVRHDRSAKVLENGDSGVCGAEFASYRQSAYMSAVFGSWATAPGASSSTRTPIIASSAPQPKGAHPKVRSVPIASAGNKFEGNLVFREKSRYISLRGADLQLARSISSDALYLASEYRSPLLTTITREAKLAGPQQR
jgi:hypothetical protein